MVVESDRELHLCHAHGSLIQYHHSTTGEGGRVGAGQRTLAFFSFGFAGSLSTQHLCIWRECQVQLSQHSRRTRSRQRASEFEAKQEPGHLRSCLCSSSCEDVAEVSRWCLCEAGLEWEPCRGRQTRKSKKKRTPHPVTQQGRRAVTQNRAVWPLCFR